MQQKIKTILLLILGFIAAKIKIILPNILNTLKFAAALVISIIVLLLLSILRIIESLIRNTPYTLLVSTLALRLFYFDSLVSEDDREKMEIFLIMLLGIFFVWGYALEFKDLIDQFSIWIYRVRDFIYRVYKFIKSHRIILTILRVAVIELSGIAGILILLFSKWVAGQTINLHIPVDPSRLPALLETFTWIALIMVICLVSFTIPVVIPILISNLFICNFILWYSHAVLLVFRGTRPPVFETVTSSARQIMTDLSLLPELKNDMENIANQIESLVYSLLRALGSIAAAFLFNFISQEIHDAINHILRHYILRYDDIIVSYLIAMIGHYEHGFCENYEPSQGERMALVGENMISVAVPDKERGGYKFEIRSCGLDSIYRQR